MIKVTRKDYTLTVDGHAGYAEPGKDIVCASASMLFFTLLRELQRRDIEVTAKTDEVREITATVNPAFSFDADIVYETICTGFMTLAEEYPDHVSFEDIS